MPAPKFFIEKGGCLCAHFESLCWDIAYNVYFIIFYYFYHSDTSNNILQICWEFGAGGWNPPWYYDRKVYCSTGRQCCI